MFLEGDFRVVVVWVLVREMFFSMLLTNSANERVRFLPSHTFVASGELVMISWP